eukprot:Phypoly_transcript_20153.p1 GENE.Phypoly_transcript_20153~~Phypoly_transcript_20153.p1  ORF type:complete len:186 (+),score=22.53 Phypoly_transcript_20153:114-671(+)
MKVILLCLALFFALSSAVKLSDLQGTWQGSCNAMAGGITATTTALNCSSAAISYSYNVQYTGASYTWTSTAAQGTSGAGTTLYIPAQSGGGPISINGDTNQVSSTDGDGCFLVTVSGKTMTEFGQMSLATSEYTTACPTQDPSSTPQCHADTGLTEYRCTLTKQSSATKVAFGAITLFALLAILL